MSEDVKAYYKAPKPGQVIHYTGDFPPLVLQKPSFTGILTYKGVAVEELIAAVRDMHAADEAYGCGYYNDDRWRHAYKLTQDLINERKD